MIKTPLLDNRTSEDIYNQSLVLAKHYCPEWANKNWPQSYFDPDDPGLVVLKLFSNLTGFLITQLNKKPDKHRIAFFDFMGIDLNRAKSAMVPLTFYLMEGAPDAFVPRATAIGSKKPDVIFETTKDLNVVNMSAIYSLNPWDDSYTDHGTDISGKGDAFSIFGKNKTEKRIDHILYLGDETLFNIQRTPDIFRITLVGSNLERDFFGQWYAGKALKIKEIKKFKNNDNDLLSVDFEGLEKIPYISIDGSLNLWLSARPNEEKKLVSGVELPIISSVSAEIAVSGIQPDFVFFNNVPQDVKKGFYPFGEFPKAGDAFYLGSEEAFSKENAEIKLSILTETQTNILPNLIWEYWNGKIWDNLINFNLKDDTNAFSKDGLISFNCPSIIPVEINGQISRWIRVRIESGNYGIPSMFEVKPVDEIINRLKLSSNEKDEIIKELQNEKVAFGRYTESTLRPPFIRSINLQYELIKKPINNIKAYNNFQFTSVNINKANPNIKFEPYKLPGEEQPALYIGFQKERTLCGASVSIYFALKEKICGEPVEQIQNPMEKKDIKQVSEFIWEYHNDTGWKKLEFEDETGSFICGGIISFRMPSDMKSSDKFNKNLYWIRAKPKNGEKLICPKLNGIFPNTVWAINLLTVEDEILGSGNGQPGLSFSFSKKPIFEDQVIEIKEEVSLSETEIKKIEEEEGADAVRKIKDEKTGEIKEVWVRWHEVKNFALSGSLDRHYVIDRSNGKITFGDSTRGISPPKGKNNIVARLYRSSSGKKGNLEPGTITTLRRPILNIERVINHFSSSGGSDEEDLENAIFRSPHTIKNRNRAITVEDFEWLARDVSHDIVKAKCISGDRITVLILQERDDETPQPDAGLKESVEKYLKERALLTIRDRIKVVGPDYKKINLKVSVKIRLEYLSESSIISERIMGRLKTFLHPVKGGQYGKGWDFGKDIYFSEVAAVIEDIEGVDYVKNIEKIEKGIAIKEMTGAGRIIIDENTLPCAGNIIVEIIER